MNKTLREGVDIRIALLSGAKRLILSTSTSNSRYNSATSVQTNHNIEVESKVLNRTPFRTQIIIYFRKFARFGYRLLKPLLRPIASKVKYYLIEGLRQEILNALDASQREVRKELDASQREVRKELQVINAGILPRLDQIEQYSYATARRVTVNCDSGEVLVKTVVGYMVCSANDIALLASLVDTGDMEPGTRRLIQGFIKPGDVYVDVGANIGIHTLAAARAMEGQGKIIAFEPFEPTKNMLDKTIWMNGFSNITEIHQAAVSNISGCQNLYIGRTSGHHSLFPLEDTVNQKQTVDVPTVRLDGVIPPDQKIDLMKIDAEGAELEVIESGASLILNNPNIALIVEFGPEHLHRKKTSHQQWFKAFTQLGLNYRVINHSSGVLEEWTDDQLQRVDSANLFFSRDDSLAWRRLNI